MHPTRRQLLGAGVAAVVGAGLQRGFAAPAPTTSPAGRGTIGPHLRLSCAAYSFRDYLPRPPKTKGRMTLHDWIDLAAVWGLDAVEPTSYYFSSEDTPYLHSLKAKAFKLGLDVSGTAVGNNFCLPPGAKRDEQIAHVKRWVDNAVEIGAPVIRIFAGSPTEDTDRDKTFGWAVDCMKTCCDYAGERGTFLAVENHGYLTETADNLLRFVEAVNHEWFGVNLDTGNFRSDPYECMAKAAPKAINVQVKIQVVAPDGKGRVDADFERVVRILRGVNYRGYLALEYEGDEDPMTGVPKAIEKLRAAVASTVGAR